MKTRMSAGHRTTETCYLSLRLNGLFACLVFLYRFEATFGSYDSSYVYLEIKNARTDASRTICVNYQQFRHHTISESPEEATPLKLGWWGENVHNYDVCDSAEHRNLSSLVIPSMYRVKTDGRDKYCPALGSLNWTDQFPFVVERIQESQASAALFLMRKGQKYYTQFDDYLFADFRDPFLGKNKSFPPVKIPVFYTYMSKFRDEVLSLSEKVELDDLELRFYRPHSFEVDGAMGIILLLALLSVAVGGWWSGKYRLQLWEEEQTSKRQLLAESGEGREESPDLVESGGQGERQNITRKSKDKEEEREPPAAPFSWFTVVIFVAVIVGMLLLLYYFYSYLVWFIIVMFTMASCLATFSCLSALMEPIPCGKCRAWSLAEWYSSLCGGRELSGNCCSTTAREKPLIRDIILFLFCAAVSIVWCIFRKWGFSFVLQDILSVFFCIHLIKTLRLPSLKWLTILLGALLVYDLFMVFITPYFTKDGCSIMVEVATGGGCDQGEASYPRPPELREQLPIIFRVPRVTDPVLSCYDLSVDLQYPPMMLGLGDVILPGLLIGFCFAMDFIWKIKYHIYGAVSVGAYGLGMVITFGALMLMKRAQPALIYLVPLTLIPIIIVAKARKELGILWRGDMPEPESVGDEPKASEPLASAPPLLSYNTTQNTSSHPTLQANEGQNGTVISSYSLS